MTARTVEAILDERARTLAQPLSSVDAHSRRHALEVRVGEERYAIEAEHLVSVIPEVACAPVPGSVPEIVGLVGFRGRVLAVADLAIIIGVKAGNAKPVRPILVVRAGAARVGLAVEGINEMLEFPPAAAATDQLREGYGKFVHNPYGDRFPWIVRIDALLSHPVIKILSSTQP